MHVFSYQVSEPVNGQDVSLNLVLHSESAAARPLFINISVQAMRYNGSPAVIIQTDVKEKTMQPGKGDTSSGKMFMNREAAILSQGQMN